MNGGHLVLLVLFWVSVACILHSYLFYPLLLDLAFRRKNKSGNLIANKNEALPFISVLLAVHNEEKVIEQKISSTLASSYPADKMEWLIGSDQSKDRTDVLINAYAALYPHIRLIRFDQRRGKVLIINELANKAKGEILILTDANVFFTPDTIYELVRNFTDPSVALVAGNIINPDISDHGISARKAPIFLWRTG
jgi:cellulose synthase/poly-beta-1,6-N-acetylglucosamine synthase-like glycosyltransferase